MLTKTFKVSKNLEGLLFLDNTFCLSVAQKTVVLRWNNGFLQ